MATFAVYVGSWIGVESERQLRPKPQPWQHQIWAAFSNYIAACGNARSLIHCARPGIEPASLKSQCWVLNLWSPSGNSKTFFFFRAAPVAYGSSQARGQIRVVAAGLHQSHSNAGSTKPRLWPTHNNTLTGSLTHWARPGIKTESSWILVGFVTTEPRWECPKTYFLELKKKKKQYFYKPLTALFHPFRVCPRSRPLFHSRTVTSLSRPFHTPLFPFTLVISE